MRIEHDDTPGSVVVQGWAINALRGFSTAFTFHHSGTCPCASGEQRHLYGTGMAIGTGNMMAPGATFHPQLVLRNNSSSPMRVTPVFKYHLDGAQVPVTLPAVNLGAQRTVVTDLRQYQLDGTIPLTVNDGDIQLNYQSDNGVLIGELASVDTDGSFVSPVPLICSGNRALHMAFWRTDGDWDSRLTIENISNQSNEVEITISHPGGLYLVEKTLAAGETGMISVKELQQSQTRDRDGHTIPFTATVGGMNVWSKNVNNGLVINGMIVNPVARTCGYCGAFGIANEWGLSDIPRNCAGSFEDRDVGDAVPLHMWISFSTNQCGDDGVQDVQITTPLVLQPGLDSTTLDTVGVGTGSFTADSQGTWPLDEQSCDLGIGRHLNASGQIGVKPKIDSLSPSRGLIGTTIQVNISGHFASTATPTVQVAGSGVTATVGSTNSSNIQTSFTIAANATAGNHAVTVKVNNRTSNSVNFFVQIPSKLLPYTDSNLAPNGIGPLRTPVNEDVRTLEGRVVFQNFCGVYRSYLFFLADQEGQRIQTAFTFDEIFSNVISPSGLADVTYTAVDFPANYVAIEDLQSLGFVGGCPNNNEFQTFTQKFKITINGTPFFPTTTINIKRGNEGGVLKVDRTITTP